MPTDADSAALLEEFRGHLHSRARSSSTIRQALQVLRFFLKRHPEADLRHPPQPELVAYFTEPKLSPCTLHGRYSVFRSFCRWLLDSERTLTNPMLLIQPPRLGPKLPTRIMTVGETRRMLEAVPADPLKPRQYRNRLMLELLYSCSLRRGELVSLDVDDYDASSKSIRIKAQNTKTRSGRIVPVGSVAAELLERYLAEVRPKAESQALFLSRDDKTRLGSSSVTAFVTELRKTLGLRTKATSHSFRKSSATHMLRNSAPLVSVSRLLGHTDICATQVYTKVYPADIVAMHRAHHPREKQKNLVMPELHTPTFLFRTQKQRLESSPKARPSPALLRTLTQVHPREREELPGIALPLYVSNLLPLRPF